jgi:hypothetical protein
MAAPAVLYCVGATKAGTSWLYRYLHDHPDCAMPAVNENHYWDAFDADNLEKQLVFFRVRLREMRDAKADASDASCGWQVEILDRRIIEMKALVATLEGDRTDDRAFLSRMLDWRTDGRVVGDMTSSYVTLSDDMIARMRDAQPASKFILLIRDPLDGLWSHIRMQARRQQQAHELYEKKSNNILYWMLNRGQETHILERGNYPKIIRKPHRLIPGGRLLIQFTEGLFTPQGLKRVCDFLGIATVKPEVQQPVHEGPEVVMLDKLRARALGLLNEHYEWVARNIGPLPHRWLYNQARA